MRRLIGLALLAAPGLAMAGPPFITDDPEPTDLHKWEIYNFAAGTREGGQTSSDLGVDLNYGGAKDLQLTLSLPFAQDPGSPRALGDIEVAAKYKLLHQGKGNFGLDVALFPRLFLPTGRGSTRARLLLPVWAQRDWGKWSLFGGGGYVINPGPGQRNYWQQGAVLTRTMAPGWQLGLEYYGAGPASVGDRPIHGVNLGTVVHIKGPVSLLGSVGKGLNREQTVFYTSLKLDL
ncbi:MAG: hypothetical protein JSS36_07390 [Proteobacteria bacterium]|nr:hypothetical protein [Pseudomonadota bacterium]